MSGQKINKSDEIKIPEETWYKKFKETNPKTGAVLKKCITGAPKVLPTAGFVVATTTTAVLTGDIHAAFAAGGLATLGGSLAGNGIKNIRDARKAKSHKALQEAWQEIERRQQIVAQQEKDLQTKQQKQNHGSDVAAANVSVLQEPLLASTPQQQISSTKPNQPETSYLDSCPELFDIDFSQQLSANNSNPNSVDYSPLANIDSNEPSPIFNPQRANTIDINGTKANTSNPFLQY